MLSQDSRCSAGTLGSIVALAAAVASGCFCAAAQAEEAPTSWNKAGVSHALVCVAPTKGSEALARDIEGSALQTLTGPVAREKPEVGGEACKSKAGYQIQAIEAVASAGLTLYYLWPFNAATQAPGFVARSELASAPKLNEAARAGNGTAAPAAPGNPQYRIQPEDMVGPKGSAHELFYKGGETLYEFAPYGRPVGGAEYALMTWSWINVSGGGIARAAVKEGAAFYPANVQPITSATLNSSGAPNGGTVTVRYGYVLHNGSEKTYGWMVTKHTFEGRCYDHMTYVGGGAQLPETLCPEASQHVAYTDAWKGSLFIDGPGGAFDTDQGVEPGSSASLAVQPSGEFEAAFVGKSTNRLFTYNSATGPAEVTPAQGVMPGTSPSITALSTGGFEIAFQAHGTGELIVLGPAGNIATGLQMATGSSPSIAASPLGGYDTAFRANTGHLWTFFNGMSEEFHPPQGVSANSSPSISPFGSGYEIAFQGASGNELVLLGVAGNFATGLGMAAGTNPSIATSPLGGYDTAFQANTGHLWTYSNGKYEEFLPAQGIKSGTSPSIAPHGEGYEIAFQGSGSDELVLLGVGGNIATGAGMRSDSSPSIGGA